MIAVPSQPPKNVQATPLSSRSIRVAWSPPPLYTLHGILQGYKVLYKPVRLDEGDLQTAMFQRETACVCVCAWVRARARARARVCVCVCVCVCV